MSKLWFLALVVSVPQADVILMLLANVKPLQNDLA